MYTSHNCSSTILLLSTHQTRRLDVSRVSRFAVTGVLEDFAWVHQPVWIKGSFDASHDVDCVIPEFFDQGFFFA